MSIQNLNIHQRWTKEYFNFDQLSSPEVSDIGEEQEQIEEQGMDRGREGDMRREGVEEFEEALQVIVRDQVERNLEDDVEEREEEKTEEREER